LSKTRGNIYIWNKAFSKTKYLQNYRDIVLWSHYFIKLLFYKPWWVVFKHLWENLVKGMFMSPIDFESIYKAFFPYMKLFPTSPWHDHYWVLVLSLF
jgi:hypothetical protein